MSAVLDPSLSLQLLGTVSGDVTVSASISPKNSPETIVGGSSKRISLTKHPKAKTFDVSLPAITLKERRFGILIRMVHLFCTLPHSPYRLS